MVCLKSVFLSLLSLTVGVTTAQPLPTQTKQAAKPVVLPKPQSDPGLDVADIPYEKRIRLERIQGVYIPKDLKDAHAQLTQMAGPHKMEQFKSLPEERAWRSIMGTVGQWIIIKWSLYEGSRIGHYLRELGVAHPEDQAAFLLITWHRQATGADPNIADLVKHFKEKRYRELLEQTKNDSVITIINKPKSEKN